MVPARRVAQLARPLGSESGSEHEVERLRSIPAKLPPILEAVFSPPQDRSDSPPAEPRSLTRPAGGRCSSQPDHPVALVEPVISLDRP